MKDIRFDLALFGEGEGSGFGGGTAEQSGEAEHTAESNSDPLALADQEENDGRKLPFPEEGEKIDPIRRIAFLLGLNCADGDSVINELKSRRAKNLLLEKLKSRDAERVYSQILSEAQAFSEKQKGFDLKKEMADRRFSVMLRAGLSVEEAWRAVHTEELISEAREEAERRAVSLAMEKIRLSMARPYENGGAGASPAQSHKGVENLSGRGIREILRRVENGAKIKF